MHLADPEFDYLDKCSSISERGGVYIGYLEVVVALQIIFCIILV
jgi:hypothetical protein